MGTYGITACFSEVYLRRKSISSREDSGKELNYWRKKNSKAVTVQRKPLTSSFINKNTGMFHKLEENNQAWQHTSTIPALKRQKQQDGYECEEDCGLRMLSSLAEEFTLQISDFLERRRGIGWAQPGTHVFEKHIT